MATTERKKAPRKKTADDGRAEAALERLNASLDAAQEAAKALRADVGRGRRDMTRNLEKMIAATRKDAVKLAKAVRADVAQLQKAVASPPARPRAQAGPTRARRATPRKATTKAPAKGTTARSSASKR